MRSNEQLHTKDDVVAKADMQVADLLSGGYLVNEQMQQFIRIAIRGTVASGQVWVTTMKNPTLEIPKMTTMGRVMSWATESEAPAAAQRSAPGFGQTLITNAEAIAVVHIPRQALEDQIERDSFQGSVTAYAGEHVRADVEDLLINGDTTSADAWLVRMNGLLARATTNVFPAGNINLDKFVLRDTFETLPEQFEDQPNLQYWTNRRARTMYRSTLSDRQTGGIGDAVILGALGKEIGYDDIKLVRVPRFPNTLNPAGNKTNVLLLNPKNAVLAFGRQMTMDTEWRPEQRVYALIVTMRIGINYVHEPMVVKTTQVIGR